MSETDELKPGLEGVTVAETRLSNIDGENGQLVIAGFPVDELAPNATFEEVLYLLREDELPTHDELADFRAELATRRAVADEAIETVVRAAGEEGQTAMDALRMGISAASLGREGEEDPAEDSLDAVAKMPTLAAAYKRASEGNEPVEPREDLRHAASYIHLLTGEDPDEEAARGLETYLNTVVDHGLNASTFTARTIVSTESDVVSGVTGAVGALKGPLHGGAPGPVLDMIERAHERGDPEAVLRKELEGGNRLMGFGHRVYRTRDPRAAVLEEASKEFYEGAGSAFFETARETEQVGIELLEERKPDLNLSTNVEFYTAVLLRGVGIPRDLFSPTFAVGRAAGWTAHCLEQLEDNRLIRPRSRYVGGEDRTWTPVEERE